jgi:putative DNA primase/helicase
LSLAWQIRGLRAIRSGQLEWSLRDSWNRNLPVPSRAKFATLPDLPTRAIHGAVDHRKGSEMANVHDFPNRNLHESLASAPASSFKMSGIQWLWPNRFALGKLGILAGLPDEGKGQVFANMAATVSQGGEWPCGEGMAPQGNVLLLTAEDAIEDTVVPRLVAAGADLDRIEIVRMVGERPKERMFSLVTDLDLLRQKMVEIGDVKLVQIDPITAYLGNAKMDSYRTNDVRAVLSPVVNLAAELNVAIIGIMHFNKKLDVNNALLRISDSLAYGATARHV